MSVQLISYGAQFSSIWIFRKTASKVDGSQKCILGRCSVGKTFSRMDFYLCSSIISLTKIRIDYKKRNCLKPWRPLINILRLLIAFYTHPFLQSDRGWEEWKKSSDKLINITIYLYVHRLSAFLSNNFQFLFCCFPKFRRLFSSRKEVTKIKLSLHLLTRVWCWLLPLIATDLIIN